MAVGVVELLEVVDVDHRDDVAPVEAAQALFQRAAAGKPGQRVVEREPVDSCTSATIRIAPAAAMKEEYTRGEPTHSAAM